MKIQEACEAYMRELTFRNARKTSKDCYRSVFRNMTAFAAAEGIDSLDELDRTALRRWREQWTWAPSTQRRALAQLKAFFTFVREEGWISVSPAEGMRRPQSDTPPTMPLSTDEVRALLAAAVRKPKEHALVLLLRYSGLALIDAATLRRDAVRPGGNLVLRRAKSGELVTVALPDVVVAALDAVAEPGRPHYFWSGGSEPETAAKYWRRRLKRVAEAAGVVDFRPHRMRDTFAVELLLSDVSIEDVSTLLGHSSLRTTERYYAPWNLRRQERLGLILRRVHQRDPVLLDFAPKKPVGAVAAAPTEAGLATTRVPKPTRLHYA